MITKEDLKLEIEQLDDSYLDLVFRLLQQFSHQQKTELLNDSLSIDYPKTEIDNRFALTAIEDTTEHDKPNKQTKTAMRVFVLKKIWKILRLNNYNRTVMFNENLIAS